MNVLQGKEKEKLLEDSITILLQVTTMPTMFRLELFNNWLELGSSLTKQVQQTRTETQAINLVSVTCDSEWSSINIQIIQDLNSTNTNVTSIQDPRKPCVSY